MATKKLLTSDKYLTEKKQDIIHLAEYLVNDSFNEASVLAVNATGKRYSISRAGMNVSDDSLLCTRGFVIRVTDGEKWAEHSCNSINPEDYSKISSSLKELIKKRGKSTACEKHSVAEEKDAAHYTEYEIHPEEMGDEAILAWIEKVRSKTLACDDKLMDCSVFCSYANTAKFFVKKTSDKLVQKEQSLLWMTGGISVMASRGDEIKDYYKGYSNLGGAEVLKEMENDCESIAKSVVALLDSCQIEPGEYECICAPDVTGLIVHEAFGHGVEMDMFVKNRALAEEYIDEYVASPLVTMHDGATAAKQTATFYFDDEGVDGQDTIIIEKGVLKRGISDLRSAYQTKTEPTGNGRRESYKRKAYTRMTNTFFEAGKDKPEDMIASIKYGFLLENASSGMEDPKNWGIQCMVNVAKEIKDGKLTGKIFSPIVLTGYVPDLLKSITMISDEVVLSGGGYCGKGYKEWVKVSDGGPYIKARIRLG